MDQYILHEVPPAERAEEEATDDPAEVGEEMEIYQAVEEPAEVVEEAAEVAEEEVSVSRAHTRGATLSTRGKEREKRRPLSANGNLHCCRRPYSANGTLQDYPDESPALVDPPASGDSSPEDDQDTTEKKFMKSNLRKNNHIVYNVQGTKYPAMVVECHNLLCKCKKMSPLTLPGISITYWQYDQESKDLKVVYYQQIIMKIPAPRLAGDRRHLYHYSIPAMKEWWPDPE